MRKIKFRAWDGKNMFTQNDDFYISLGGEVYDICSFTNYLDEVSEITVMQYTDLKDKNGVEIYEGDVLYYAPFGTVMNNRVVQFEEGQFVGTLVRSGYSNPLYEVADESIIVGNRFQNPEMAGDLI